MSPRRVSPESPERVRSAVNRIAVAAGNAVHDERVRRRWTLRELAAKAGLSLGAVHGLESGRSASLEAYARLADVLGLTLELDLADPLRRVYSSTYQQDAVHLAMGEFEARHLRGVGFEVGIDEPFQHYQFAGRADVMAWSLTEPALLHIENRTRFPNIQAAAGSYNAKRAYLPAVLARRLGISRWQSVTHVMACLWSAEVLHVLRLRAETFRALCPADAEAFEGWLAGTPSKHGTYSTLVVVDPLATGRQRLFIGFEDALTARPRHAGYAAAAARLARSDGR